MQQFYLEYECLVQQGAHPLISHTNMVRGREHFVSPCCQRQQTYCRALYMEFNWDIA